MKLLLLITCCVFSCALCQAQEERGVKDEVLHDLNDAQTRLKLERKKISEEQIELATEFQKTKAELLAQRRKARLARMSKEDRSAFIKELEIKNHKLAQNFNFVDSSLSDYGHIFQTFLLPGEEVHYEKVLSESYKNTEDPRARLQSRLAILEAGIGRMEQLLGGGSVKAEAVAPDGELKLGAYALLGPAIWFLSDDEKIGGMVFREKGSLKPKVKQGDVLGVKTLLTGGESSLAVDVTGGKAFALASLEENKLDVFRKGGFWIWPILGIALISAFAGIMKFVQIVKVRTPKPDWVAGILSALADSDEEKAREMSASAVHPVGEVVRNCLDYVKVGPDVVEEVLYEQLIGVQNKLQGGLSFIAVTAATAPLLGLLGTVAGMIRTFNMITVAGTGDAKPLAGGISEALITTLFGLVVAIPALIIHSLLSRRCQGIIQNTEKLGLTLVNGLRGERFQVFNKK